MNIFDIYETDVSLEENGVWIALAKDVKVKVAAFGNQKHKDIIDRLFAPYKTQHRKGTLDKTIEEDLHTKAMAKTILLDWEGIVDKDGSVIPYSPDKAYELLSKESMRRFKNDIVGLASEAETFRAQEIEDTTKN